VAIKQANTQAIIAVIVTMFIVIALYDQIIFRPLVAWSGKFKAEEVEGEDESESWVLDLFHKTRVFAFIGNLLQLFGERLVNTRWQRTIKVPKVWVIRGVWQRCLEMFVWLVLASIVVMSTLILWHFIFDVVAYPEAIHVVYLGLMTATRVVVLIIISCIVWVPIGVWIGMHPKASKIVQPIAQFLAAFPANLLFPVMAVLIINYHLNVNIWVSPLMILGTQWYILFNVIAGVTAMPKNLHHAVGTLNVRGWLWWRSFMLPGIFPYLVTGAITAAGGAWNISIIAEVVEWGNTHLTAVGLGAYVAEMTTRGDFPRIALGIVVMSSFVLLFNRILWRPLYQLAEKRFQVR
jgi:NitT/TauT family transport system permease protein